ncbi:MAG: chemotaxis protein CheX [Bacillota bacterium]|nr:chemotaxis protein CheX [Bacillota bacterium]
MMDINVWDVLTGYVDGAFCSVSVELMSTGFRRCDQHQWGPDRRFAVIIGFVGAFKGRVMVSADAPTTAAVTESMNFGEVVESLEEQCLYLAEFTNMFAGKIVTLLNNAFRGSDLRLTPPVMFSAVNLDVQTPTMRAAAYYFEGNSGCITMEIGIEGV